MGSSARRAGAGIALAAGALLSALAPGTASAAGRQTVRCSGSGDYCTATVKIGGGVSGRAVTVKLTDTDLRLVRVTPVGALTHRPYTISDAATRAGGSQFRFTLDAPSATPKGARLVLLFAAGTPPRGLLGSPSPLRTTRRATATLNVGKGMTVSIRGGGAGTSNCTRDETYETFTTTKESETREFGFYSTGSGSCIYEFSWSRFVFTVRDPSGAQVGQGTVQYGQGETFGGYHTYCYPYGTKWSGISCDAHGGQDATVTIDRIWS